MVRIGATGQLDSWNMGEIDELLSWANDMGMSDAERFRLALAIGNLMAESWEEGYQHGWRLGWHNGVVTGADVPSNIEEVTQWH